jgi:hypothetical protein
MYVLSALLRRRLGDVKIINFDEETNLVMSKRETSTVREKIFLLLNKKGY